MIGGSAETGAGAGVKGRVSERGSDVTECRGGRWVVAVAVFVALLAGEEGAIARGAGRAGGADFAGGVGGGTKPTEAFSERVGVLLCS